MNVAHLFKSQLVCHRPLLDDPQYVHILMRRKNLADQNEGYQEHFERLASVISATTQK